MLAGQKNTKKQGDVGVGVAIGWFTSKGYTVCVPLTESQRYDLVIEEGGVLRKVEVKTTTYKSKYGIYNANLSTKGGNRTAAGSVKKFDPRDVDYVFILTGDGSMYLIPSARIESKTIINLGKKYEEFKQKPWGNV